MFLSDVKTRFRGEIFDHMVDQTALALRDPDVVQKIGASLAATLLDVNSRLFLPNVRHDQAFVPASEKHTDNPALLPWSKKEAKMSDKMLAPMAEDYTVCRRLEDVMYARNYDLELKRVDMRSQTIHDTAAANGVVIPKKEPVDIKVNGSALIMGDIFCMSRPVVTALYRMLIDGPREMSAGIAHETVHLHDITTDGPAILFEQHRVATEYRAFHVDHAIGGEQQARNNSLPKKVETFRQELADPTRPFYPTPAMIDKAVELGIV